jgi:hypothetical protein
MPCLMVALLLLASGQVSADSGEKRIESGHFLAWEIEVEAPFTLTYQIVVESGPNVEVYLMTAKEYGRFLGGEDFQSISSGNGAASSFDETIGLDKGRYFLVVDNPFISLSLENESSSSRASLVDYDISAVQRGHSLSLEMILAMGSVVLLGMVLIAFATFMREGRQ